ncbi:MAG TPA: hypothetical protein PKM58_11280, partial [Pyrinomonadaceae bacterium]|nr:hypothetical protein [Pyrinomonadaceae bacterium]
IVILNGNDFQMSVAAQEAVRYLGNEKGLRALDNWNKANKRSYPVWGPVPIPIIDFDYEMIDLLLIEDDKQVVGLALSRYIYALAIDRKSSKSEVLLQKVLQRLRSVENESITNRIVNRLKSNYPLKPFSETKTVEDAVLENAFFLSEEDKKVTRAELLSFNAKGDKALIELHLSRGFLAEEWYHVVVEKEVNGWKFFSITFTKQS